MIDAFINKPNSIDNSFDNPIAFIWQSIANIKER